MVRRSWVYDVTDYDETKLKMKTLWLAVDSVDLSSAQEAFHDFKEEWIATCIPQTSALLQAPWVRDRCEGRVSLQLNWLSNFRWYNSIMHVRSMIPVLKKQQLIDVLQPRTISHCAGTEHSINSCNGRRRKREWHFYPSERSEKYVRAVYSSDCVGRHSPTVALDTKR